jgi:hypothetical protein
LSAIAASYFDGLPCRVASRSARSTHSDAPSPPCPADARGDRTAGEARAPRCCERSEECERSRLRTGPAVPRRTASFASFARAASGLRCGGPANHGTASQVSAERAAVGTERHQCCCVPCLPGRGAAARTRAHDALRRDGGTGTTLEAVAREALAPCTGGGAAAPAGGRPGGAPVLRRGGGARDGVP